MSFFGDEKNLSRKQFQLNSNIRTSYYNDSYNRLPIIFKQGENEKQITLDENIK